jgi:beta propeller repeat protein
MVTSSGGGLGSGGVASSGGATGSGGASGPLIGNLQMLATLNDIQPLAVGTNGVSVLQYSNAGEALVLYVDWSGKATTWYRTARSSYGYLGASGAQHVALLYTSARYEIALNGDAQDLSGSATTYKESITANGRGFAWVNFEAMGSPPVTSMTGSIVLQDWAGGRIALTDALRYRSRPQMSDDWLVYVEYASIAPGSIGQIQVQGLTAGAVAKPAAASAHHQDRPVTDGDWVVWEEYLSSKDSVIRARNITSGEVRDLSSLVGFRTSPDIKGTRVVWQDERSGGGEIYLNDLATTGGERVVVSGKGYSAAPRLTSDGLVWIESYSGSTGLVKATWTR